MDTSTPPATDTEAWRTIVTNPSLSPYKRWCAGQATAHADRIAMLSPRTRTGLAVRDDEWHTTAMVWYALLASRPEPARPVVCVVAAPSLLDAVLGPATTLPEAVELAQQQGLFGVPGHRVRLEVVDADYYLVIVDTPAGMSLTGGPLLDLERPLSRGDLHADLNRVAEHVDSALEAPTLADRLAREPWHVCPFPPLDTPDSPAIAHAPEPPPPADAPHRSR
jgi:hypothetical protein